MTSHLNNNANMPWVWSVAQRLEQQPRKLKMRGSIPCHAHNFLIRSAIGVRTTIEHVFLQKWMGLLCVMSSCVCSYTIKNGRRV